MNQETNLYIIAQQPQYRIAAYPTGRWKIIWTDSKCKMFIECSRKCREAYSETEKMFGFIPITVTRFRAVERIAFYSEDDLEVKTVFSNECTCR